MPHPFTDPAVSAAFDAFPDSARTGTLMLRDLILDQAATLPEIGTVQEVLRWGQPSYITPDRKAATTLRIGTHKSAAFAIFAHCQSGVITNYATRFPCWDRLDGNRAVLFNDTSEVEPFRLGTLIRDALTYHLKSPQKATA